MNILDIIFILIIISFMAMGSKNGIIKEAVGFIGIIATLIVAYILKGYVGRFLCLYFPFIELKGSLEGITTFNIFMYETLAFILTFGILYGLYELLIVGSNFLQKILNMTIVLILPSKILGALVGAIKCWLILFMVLVAMMIPLGTHEIVRESKLTKIILYKTPVISSYTSSFTNSVKEFYEVVIKTSKKKKPDTIKANLKCLEIMLKYKVVDKQTVVELIETEKLENVDGAEEILKKY